MDFIITPLTVLSLLTAAVAFVVGVVSWRCSRMGRYLACMLWAVAQWSLFAGIELASIGSPAKQFWSFIEYFGTLACPVGYLLFALEYNYFGRWITRRNVLLLCLIPFIVLTLAATNPWHHLIWTGFYTGVPSANTIVYGHGPLWFLGVVGYSYFLLAIGTVLLLWSALRFPPQYRHQAFTLVIGAVVPWLVSIVYVSGWSPIRGWDPTPQAFVISGAFFAWDLFRGRLLTLLPMARDMLVENLRTGMLVVDVAQRVVDLNPAARAMLRIPAGSGIGHAVSHCLANWPALAERGLLAAQGSVEERRADGGYFEWTATPLNSSHGDPLGLLLTVRDITRHKREQHEREHLLEHLQQALAEVKDLSGLLPICASCKKIRDDHGYWTQIEKYIQTHSNAVFSHGICPDCMQKLYPRYNSKD
jgi:PAS domain-containing protein